MSFSLDSTDLNHNRCGASGLHSRRLWRCTFIILLALVMVMSAHAIGISPVRSSLVFDHNGTYRGNLLVVDTSGGGGQVNIYAEGELASYVRFATNRLTMNGDVTPVPFEVRFPKEQPDPGEYEVRIYAEPASASGQGIGAKARVGHTLTITVPGNYSRIAMNMTTEEIGNMYRVDATVANVGSADIDRIVGQVQIFNQLSPIKVMTTPEDTLRAGGTLMIGASVHNDSLLPGAYTVRVVVDYDGKLAHSTSEFHKGVPSLVVIEAPPALNKAIEEVEVVVSNEWNTVTDASVKLAVRDSDGKVIEGTESSSEVIDAYGNSTFNAFVDLRNAAEGEGSLIIRTHRGSEIKEQSVPVLITGAVVAEPEVIVEETNFVVMLLPIILGFLVVLGLLYYRGRKTPPQNSEIQYTN